MFSPGSDPGSEAPSGLLGGPTIDFVDPEETSEATTDLQQQLQVKGPAEEASESPSESPLESPLEPPKKKARTKEDKGKPLLSNGQKTIMLLPYRPKESREP